MSASYPVPARGNLELEQVALVAWGPELSVRVSTCRFQLQFRGIHFMAVAGQEESRHDPNHHRSDHQLHADTVLSLRAYSEPSRGPLAAAAPERQPDVRPTLRHPPATARPDAARTTHEERAGPSGDRFRPVPPENARVSAGRGLKVTARSPSADLPRVLRLVSVDQRDMAALGRGHSKRRLVTRTNSDRQLDPWEPPGPRAVPGPREPGQVALDGDQREPTADDIALSLEAVDARLGSFRASDHRRLRCGR